jgi:hypothetical protein
MFVSIYNNCIFYNRNFTERKYTQIAKYGYAYQESTGYDGIASRAIDGITAGNWLR